MAAALTCGVCGKGPGGAEGPAGEAAAGPADLLSCVSCLAADEEGRPVRACHVGCLPPADRAAYGRDPQAFLWACGACQGPAPAGPSHPATPAKARPPPPAELPVACNGVRATFLVAERLVRVAGRPAPVSPSAFERLAGRGGSKKWRMTVKVLDEAGRPVAGLGDWLVARGLEQPKARRAPGPGPRFDPSNPLAVATPARRAGFKRELSAMEPAKLQKQKYSRPPKAKDGGARWGDVWEQCESCARWYVFEKGQDAKRCKCGTLVKRTAVADADGGAQLENWVQCDVCLKWRVIDASALRAVEGGEAAAWTCAMRGEGASCETSDDWELELKRERAAHRKKLAREEQELKEDVQAALQEVARQRRQWRSEQRANGAAAASARQDAPPEVPQDLRAAMEWSTGGAVAKRFLSEPVAEGAVDLDVWEQCTRCSRWVNLGVRGEAAACECGETVRHAKDAGKGKRKYRHWAQCSECGKWRAVTLQTLRRIESLGDSCVWTCKDFKEGLTCRSRTGDWGSEVRKESERLEEIEKAVQTGGGADAKFRLCDRLAVAGEAEPQTVFLAPHPVKPGCAFLEFVPGRDTVRAPEACAAGLHLFCKQSTEHVLWATSLPAAALASLRHYMEGFLLDFQNGNLPINTDGRVSCGPVNLNHFIALPSNQAAIQEALQRRRRRLVEQEVQARRAAEAAAPAAPPRPSRELLSHVVHVAPNQRQVYIGDEHDVTATGKPVMEFNKSWKSLPIRSWSGGKRMADMGGARGLKLVDNPLSKLLPHLEAHVVDATEQIWDKFAAEPTTRDAAARMVEHCEADPVKSAARLGRTAWNAYSINANYRTGNHLDAKNVPGSYSCLAVLEAGRPFCGSYYMVPHFREALDLRQGCVVFHRSGDKDIGYHGNSEIHCPEPGSLRISVVLYQTELKTSEEDFVEGGNLGAVAAAGLRRVGEEAGRMGVAGSARGPEEAAA